MFKPRWVLSVLLISGTIILSALSQAISSQNYSEKLQQLATENIVSNRQKQPRPNPKGNRRGGARLIDQLGRRRSATRSGLICLIAPAPQLQVIGNQIWSDRPLFIWQGTAQRIELRESRTQKILWRKNLTPNDITAVYDGEPLQPGQSYIWQLLTPEKIERRVFRLLDSSQRQEITNIITARQDELKKDGATPEEITLDIANEFADRGLWSDALQIVYSVDNPSPEVTRVAQELAQEICGAAERPKNSIN